jgi:regulator of protease activity HflC (stomatin/prohibitin superfamily)
VADPRRFLFGARDPEEFLRAAAESVLRELVAGRAFGELLTVGRSEFEAAALARLKDRCRETDPHGLGVTLEALAVHDLHPPGEVVPAYHSVAQAMEDAERQVNDAQARSLGRRRDVQARAERSLRLADAGAAERLALAGAAREAFLAWHVARSQLTPEAEAALAADRMRRVVGGEDAAAATADWLRRRAERLAVQRFVSDARLYWEVATDVLKRRNLTLVEADGKPGRLHLFLMELEQRLVPILGPAEPAPRSQPGVDDGP